MQNTPLPQGWISQNDPQGKQFFVNTGTGQSQYAPPQMQGYAPPPGAMGNQQGQYPGQYPQQQGYAPQMQQGQYPPPQGQYPPQQQGFAPQQGQYTPPQGQYPPQQQQGFAPQGQHPPQYPPQQQGFAFQQGQYPPPQQGQYPPQQQGYAPQQQVPQQESAPAPVKAKPVSKTLSEMAKRVKAYTTPLDQSQVNKAVMEIRGACEGMGTDEKAVINALAVLSPVQIRQVSIQYAKDFGKSLEEMLDSETSGDFGRLIESMLKVGSGEFDACVLHRAMDGAGTDEAEIIDCVVGRCNAELEAISEAYKILYGKDLVSVLKKELSGKFEKLILRVLEGRKEDESANVDDDVKALYNAGEKKLGTDEKMFIAVICGRPTAHIGKIVEGYQSTHHKSLEKVIKSEFTGDLERGLIAVVDSCVDNTERIARSIESTMKGVGTNERKLGTLLIRYRDPSRQAEIKEAYQKKYGRSLSEAISSETSGDFEMLLLALIGN